MQPERERLRIIDQQSCREPARRRRNEVRTNEKARGASAGQMKRVCDRRSRRETIVSGPPEVVKKLTRLTRVWRRFDPDPPIGLLEQIAAAFDVELAAGVIEKLGAGGRLETYGHDNIHGLIRLKVQQRQLSGEEGGA